MSTLDMKPEFAERARGPGAGEHRPTASRHAATRRLLLRNPAALAGFAILGVIVLTGLFAPLLAPANPQAIAGLPLIAPGTVAGLPFGTDALGRDVFAGIVHGARVSLLIGVVATLLSLVIGVSVGAIAGYFGGWVDDLVVRLIEIFQTIPGFVLLVVLVAFLQPSVSTVTAGIALISWDMIARLTRAEFRSLREKEFVQAAVTAGFTPWRIILREILPNALPSLIVTTSIMVASAILAESALSFMGLGDPNVVTWGSMIGSGRELLRTHAWLSIIPGLCIVLTVLALNLIGDALNDALRPRGRTGA